MTTGTTISLRPWSNLAKIGGLVLFALIISTIFFGSDHAFGRSIRDFAPFAILALVIAAVTLAVRERATLKPSRWGLLLATLPALVMLGLYYSLAIHMHSALGGWPTSIGTAGFAPALARHCQVAEDYVWSIVPVSFYAWPLAFLLCLFISKWKRAIPYLATYALAFLVCLEIMRLAPAQFLTWWMD